jgi:hypothetical protein
VISNADVRAERKSVSVNPLCDIARQHVSKPELRIASTPLSAIVISDAPPAST